MRANPTTLFARLDGESRKLVHRATIRLGWYAGGTVLGWLVFTRHSLGELATDIQFMCTLGAMMAIMRGYIAKTRINTPSLNDWDEAMLLNLLGLGVHLSKQMLS
jgi:hypothetical protein